MFDYIKTSLQTVAIAILNETTSQSNIRKADEGADQELLYTLHGATVGQLRRVTKMLVNAIKYWSPYLVAGTDDNYSGQARRADILIRAKFWRVLIHQNRHR